MWSSICAFGFILTIPVMLWVLQSLFPLVFNMYAIKAASYANSPTHLAPEQIEKYVGEVSHARRLQPVALLDSLDGGNGISGAPISATAGVG
eukprot:7383574-Prymnesium_polylepis.1